MCQFSIFKDFRIRDRGDFLYIPEKKLKKYFSKKSRVCVSFFQNALSYYVMTGVIFQYTKQKNDIDITHFCVYYNV